MKEIQENKKKKEKREEENREKKRKKRMPTCAKTHPPSNPFRQAYGHLFSIPISGDYSLWKHVHNDIAGVIFGDNESTPAWSVV
jgi:hypothetical protein